jgi:hypothetical protein
MVAGRVGRRDIAVDVAGDAKAAEDVLVAASSLALD